MKRFILLLTVFTTILFAEVEHRYIDTAMIDSGIKIIDIRTPGEWKETGIVKGSIPIMFFDERGNYDIKTFMNTLQQHVKPTEQFALICRSGSRTRVVSDFLSKKYGYRVINLQGGINYARGKHIPLIPYRGK